MFSRRLTFACFVCLFGVVAVVVAPPAQAQRGFLTLQMNLGTLVDAAGVIVHGRVVSAQPEMHPDYSSLHTVVVTVEVSDTLKGESAAQYTFRQFVFDIRDRGTTIGYKPGQEVLLILTSPSDAGLSSPVGMAQGRFLITTDAAGNRVATNGANNMGLFLNIDETHPGLGQRLSPQLRQVLAENRGGPIPVEQLLEIIRAEVAARAEK
ncbi:MAG TPA: hypothetical protein VNN18_12570 [Candidatus Xenobia bacterium]|nr:hypothetical protein [Candidatus Xenobia bacterium]